MPISKSVQKIFLYAGLIPITLVGAVAGGFFGMEAVNFLPPGNESAFRFMGLVGWEAVTFLGLIFGVVAAIAIYTYFIILKK